MRIRKDGQRYLQDRNAQDFTFTPRDPVEAIKTEADHFLSHLDRYAPQCHANEAIPVVTVRAALRLLIDFLERMSK